MTEQFDFKPGDPFMRTLDKHLVAIGQHLAALDRTVAAHEDHLKAHDEMNVLINDKIDVIVDRLADYQRTKGKADRMRDRRISKLVERVDTLYNQLRALESRVNAGKDV